jgi:von Willebrand factor type A domain
MSRLCSRFALVAILLLLLVHFANGTVSAEPRVQIRSPQNGSNITHEQDHLLIGGKVIPEVRRTNNVDIFLVLDASGSTAEYAGVDLPEFSQLSNFYRDRRKLGGRPDPSCPGQPGPRNLRNSILSAEVVASRRFLSQLDPTTTRVGVITFGEEAWLRQALTHDFDEVRGALDLIYKRGPYGGTNMVDAIRLATDELLGKGESEKYLDSVKTMIFITDGFPTLPSRDCTSKNQINADLAIDAARLAGTAGINVHVFALGKKAASNPRAAVGIARESGGTYTPVRRPADVLAILDRVSAVGVEFIEVSNETIGEKASRSRLAADGFFASAVLVVEGLNRLEVVARASDGSVGRDTITVHYQRGAMRSLDLEVFLEREKSLKLEVDRLGKSPDQIKRELERNREEDLRQ